MRVLIAIVVAAATGCYGPNISQCQFKCGSGAAICPSGTSCLDGECLTSDGVCPNARCMATPPTGCQMPVEIDSVDCATACPGPVISSAVAETLCSAAGWRLAILDAPAKLANAPTINNEVLWVGAKRTGTAGTLFTWSNTKPVDASAWAPPGPAPTVGLDCVVVDSTHKLHNVDCGVAVGANQHHALCDHD